MTGNSEKATHYIALLDNARVNASWTELPELTRKVSKHAPQRKILIHTATAEHEVAIGNKSSSRRPPTAPGPDSTPLTTLSNTLQATGEHGTEEELQAKTCLLWSRWIGMEGGTGTAGFDTAAAVETLESKDTTLWTKICIVKSAYIEGASYMQNGRPAEAQRVFAVALPVIRSNQELVISTGQLGYWAEQLLAQMAVGLQTQVESGHANSAQMEAFKNWAAIATKTNDHPASTYRNSSAHLSRHTIWRKYYEDLSLTLSMEAHGQHHALAADSTRAQRVAELQKVERSYENELLRTVKFPTSVETNDKVEEWVEQANRNWQILCGPQWRAAELGEGGYDAVGRNMLDVLYRAATKTFHSTVILRRLFQVHLSLSEFDLAYRAFDTYMELVERSRERVAKSNQPEAGQESNEAVLTTIAEAITGLCKFGKREQARKAFELCLKLDTWLLDIGIGNDETLEIQSTEVQGLNGTSPRHVVNQQVLQTVYRAIGIGKAHWARWTPVNENRSRLQEQALINLNTACIYGNSDIETLYAKSLLLAETRDIPGAIQAAKQALARSTSSSTQSSGWVVERKLVSQWHLLALLLSSRQNFDGAAKSCIAAFEQFVPAALQLGAGQDSSVLSDVDHQFNAAITDLAVEMESDELQRILEVRITELALTELTGGPDEAVNSCDELLNLFARLFKHAQISPESAPNAKSSAPLKSATGTVKTHRTSMFHRRKHTAQVTASEEKGGDIASLAASTTRPSSQATQAPTIQITNEKGKPSGKRFHLRKSYDGSHGQPLTSDNSKVSNQRPNHNQQDVILDTSQQQSQGEVQAAAVISQSPLLNDQEPSSPMIALEHEKSAEGKQELPKVNHNLSSHNSVPPPVSHQKQPPQQDVRLPTVNSLTNATSPAPRSPKAVTQRHALTILVKVWLVIATLYRRASMFEDSAEACEEAAKAAAKIEAIVSAVEGSARAFAGAGWGAGIQSANEIWADVHCERAELQLTVYHRKVKENQSINDDELRAAVDHYEQCLMFAPNHPGGIVGLSNILLDSYERKIDLVRRVKNGRSYLTEHKDDHTFVPIIQVSTNNASTPIGTDGNVSNHLSQASRVVPGSNPDAIDEDLRKTPENLHRIAARDRAYGLLSTLTKLGTGWDHSEAWFALARAHELGGEMEKAKSILWWCIELEDTRPIRHWRNLSYTL